jgi:hypothetical protein
MRVFHFKGGLQVQYFDDVVAAAKHATCIDNKERLPFDVEAARADIRTRYVANGTYDVNYQPPVTCVIRTSNINTEPVNRPREVEPVDLPRSEEVDNESLMYPNLNPYTRPYQNPYAVESSVAGGTVAPARRNSPSIVFSVYNGWRKTTHR